MQYHKLSINYLINQIARIIINSRLRALICKIWFLIRLSFHLKFKAGILFNPYVNGYLDADLQTKPLYMYL